MRRQMLLLMVHLPAPSFFGFFLSFPPTEAMENNAYVSPVAQAVGRQARLTRMEVASSSPSSVSTSDLSGLYVGAKVRHDRFGEGEVTAIEEKAVMRSNRFVCPFRSKQLLLSLHA